MSEAGAVEGALRVWHMTSLCSGRFCRPVHCVIAGANVLDLLAAYDAFQHGGSPWTSQGLEVFEDGEWIEWIGVEGNDVNALRRIRDASIAIGTQAKDGKDAETTGDGAHA